FFEEKARIKDVNQEVRTVPSHYVWCTAEGTPPINISLLQSFTNLALRVGLVYGKIQKTGNFTCRARNEAGTDSRDFSVVIACGAPCRSDGTAVLGQIENTYDCSRTESTVSVLKCVPTTTTTLNLGFNKITNLSTEAFSRLTSLQKLVLRDNLIVELPEALFSQLRNLQQL
ncbi:unnamed protein product, partial [Porites lobata]